MKRIEISVEEEGSDKVEQVLLSSQLTYSRVSSSSEMGRICFFQTTVTDAALDSTLDRISAAMDLRKSDNQIIVLDVLAYVSTKLRNVEKKSQETRTKSPVELIAQPLNQYLKITRHPIIMILLSTVVVLAGLYLDNIPIIIGSMLLSPLLGPISASIVNGSLGRTTRLVKAEGIIFLLVAISLILSAMVSFTLSHLTSITLSQQIVSRANPPVFEVIVALALGTAAGLALTTKLPETLVGVAIAAALLPPLGVAGIYLGLGSFHAFFNAFVLTMIYLFGLKIGGIAYLRLSGITPRKFYEQKKARTYSLVSLALFSVILAVLIVALIM